MISYRPATPSDAEAVANLHARSWRENYRGSFHDAFLDGDLPGERLRVWRERLERPPAAQLVQLAVDGAELAGFVCAYGAHDAKWGSLVDNLHVARPFAGRGVGKALLRHAGAWLASRYPELGVYLLVLEANARARGFYERLGGRNAETSTMETHGGALVRSCRYTWRRPALLSLDLALAEEYALGAHRRDAIRALLAESFPDAPFTGTRTYGKQLPARRLLASDGDRLVGHLGLEHRVIGTNGGPREIFGIVDLCVAPRWRGCGVASRMLDWLEALARESGIPFLVLFAQDRRLYERNGYRHAGNPLRWAKIHEHRLTGVAEEPLAELMVKSVAGAPWPEGVVDLLGHQF